MSTALNQLQFGSLKPLSERAYHRGFKLVHTIADLAGCERNQINQLTVALHYQLKLEMM